MGKCAIIGGECPKTADRTERRFCPHWADAIPEVVRDGSGRVVAEEIFRGCFLDRLPTYLLALARDAGHSAAAYNDARNHVAESIAGGGEPLVRSLVTLGLCAVAGGERDRRLEGDEPRRMEATCEED